MRILHAHDYILLMPHKKSDITIADKYIFGCSNKTALDEILKLPLYRYIIFRHGYISIDVKYFYFPLNITLRLIYGKFIHSV